MGIALYPYGWPFDESFLNNSLLLQSIIALGDRVLLGVDGSDSVRIVHWAVQN